MKCPFCFNSMIFVEVDTDDCIRECLECTNCGLRTPGVELASKVNHNHYKEVYRASDEDEQEVIKWYEDMYSTLQTKWNPEGE